MIASFDVESFGILIQLEALGLVAVLILPQAATHHDRDLLLPAGEHVEVQVISLLYFPVAEYHLKLVLLDDLIFKCHKAKVNDLSLIIARLVGNLWHVATK